MDQLPAVLSRARPDVDHPVGRANGVLVVLDDDERVSQVAQPHQRPDQPVVVALVEPDRRLVEDVEHAHQARADLRRQPDALPLAPGRYKLSVVVKDDGSGHMGSVDLGIIVPKYNDDQLSHSSLILADLIQPIPTNQVGTGPFVIGSTKVRPSVDQTFTRDQTLGIYMQVYNMAMDPKTHRPSMNVEYEISKDGKPILSQPEDSSKWAQPVTQLTLEKQMPLKSLPPGKYNVQVKVTDNVRKQTISPTATFELK